MDCAGQGGRTRGGIALLSLGERTRNRQVTKRAALLKVPKKEREGSHGQKSTERETVDKRREF